MHKRIGTFYLVCAILFIPKAVAGQVGYKSSIQVSYRQGAGLKKSPRRASTKRSNKLTLRIKMAILFGQSSWESMNWLLMQEMEKYWHVNSTANEPSCAKL